MADERTIVVFGAYGHTGRFVVEELRARGWRSRLSGRDREKLAALATKYPDAAIAPASVEDPASLDTALHGAAAVINCAGPFADTSAPIIDAALRVRMPYVDVMAEVEALVSVFERYDEPARAAGVVIAPAMAFYGALGDLLATAAMRDWPRADAIDVAYALDRWQPTRGTRATIETSKRRRDGRRLVYRDRRLELRTDAAPVVEWTFPAPFGVQPAVAEYTTTAAVAMSRHLATNELQSYMTLAPLKGLSDPDAAPPVAVDDSGRSAQMFAVEVVVRKDTIERRAVARGRDIYAVSAPIAVEAATRLVRGTSGRGGVVTAGEIFPAEEFLRALSPAITIAPCHNPVMTPRVHVMNDHR